MPESMVAGVHGHIETLGDYNVSGDLESDTQDSRPRELAILPILSGIFSRPSIGSNSVSATGHSV